MTSHRSEQELRPLYRSRSGLLLGVCKGLAAHFNLDVFWVRIIAIVGLFITGLWPLTGLYLLAAFLMKPEPVIPFEDKSDQEFYDGYTHSRGMAVDQIKRAYDNIEQRIRRMEDRVTAREFNWKERLQNGQ
ncbi:MAG: envelope stress response membrane protein PspC [Planctomycetota bacterium]|jgi:phage shock protein C